MCKTIPRYNNKSDSAYVWMRVLVLQCTAE